MKEIEPTYNRIKEILADWMSKQSWLAKELGQTIRPIYACNQRRSILCIGIV